MNVDTAFNGNTVQWDGRYNIEEGHLDDLEEDDTVDKCVHRDGDEKPDVLKVFFDYYEGAVVHPTHGRDFYDEDGLMTNGDTDDSVWVEEPAVGCGRKTSGMLFRRCFALMSIKIVLPMDDLTRKKTSFDAYREMMRNTNMFKMHERSRFILQGPNEDGLYMMDTAHNFGNGVSFQRNWTTLERGKELVAYKVCKYFGYPNPYPVSWLVKSDVNYVEKQKRLQELRSY